MTDRSGIFAGENPFKLAQQWLAEATDVEVNDANAMSLATVDSDGLPNVRIVLLKAIEDEGFVFFTNYESRKGQEIASSGKAALNFHWKSLGRQIRIRGTVAKVEPQVSDAYYATRPLGSRIGAWASKQSQKLANKDELVASVDAAERKFGTTPSRPSHWGGFKVTPQEIEFWAHGEFRLHDRFRWQRENNNSNWRITRLNP